MRHLLCCLTLGLLWPASFALGQQNRDDLVMKAMRDELARSMVQLQLPNLGKPYFISYQVSDNSVAKISASLGQLTDEDVARDRKLKVQVRVGDFAVDNTNFMNLGAIGSGMANCGCHTTLPVDDDYDQIRRQIWLETDAAYKQSAAELAAKRSALEHRQHGQELADFTSQSPVTVDVKPRNIKVEVPRLEQLARRLSGAFHDSPEITSSGVDIYVMNQLVRFADSEGAVITREERVTVLEVRANTQASDGQPLADSFRVYAETPGELAEDELLGSTQKFIAGLKSLRTARTIEAYNGPVLFEGDAAAEVVGQVFAPAIIALRIPVSSQPEYEAQFRQVLSQFGASLADRVGSRVMPDGFELTNDPTVDHIGDTKLLGSYSIDDEAVPSREVKIVENGRLTKLLATRTPTPQTKASTGSDRGTGGAPGNLFLRSRDAVTNDELHKELFRVAQQRGYDYGIVVRRLGAGTLSSLMRLAPMFGHSESGGIAVYKVFADGREEMVRADIDPVPVTAFKEILGAGNNPIVHHSAFMSFTGPLVAARNGGTTAVVSYVVPSLLFEELSLKQPAEAAPKLPVVPSPLTLVRNR